MKSDRWSTDGHPRRSRSPLAALGLLIARVAVGCALLLGFAPSIPRAQAAPPTGEARELIEKHVAWLGGWDSLDALRDFSLQGTIQVAGLTGSIRVDARADGFQRSEYDLRVVKGTEVVGPDEGWELNASGQIEAMGRNKLADMQRSLARSFGRHFRGEGVTISLLNPEPKDGRTWSVVRFGYPSGDHVDLFLDAADGSSTWSRSSIDGETSWIRSADFRSHGGVLFSHIQETIYGNPMQDQTVTLDGITVNTGIPDERFARPGSTASIAHIAGGAASTAWMPMDLYMDRYIFLKGMVNGEPIDIILDSGAGMTVLDRPVVERLGLVAEGSLPARGTGGTTEAGIVTGVTLGLGELEVGPVTAATIDLADVNRRVGRDLSVILGKEVFHNLVVDIDYPGSRIRFHDPAKFEYRGSGHRLPVLAAEDGHKDVELQVEGLPPAIFGLDTGQGGALSIFKAYADEHAMLEGRTPVSSRRGGGVGGSTISTVATLRSVTIAGFTLHDVPASFHQENVGGAFDTARQAGNLGAGILNRFRVLFDYPRECLWLEPGEGWDTRPFARDRTGVFFIFEGDHLTVHYVAPGSPGEAAGWKEGDSVTAIDGVPVGEDWSRRMTERTRAPEGTVVRYTMADGSERSLTLRTYF